MSPRTYKPTGRKPGRPRKDGTPTGSPKVDPAPAPEVQTDPDPAPAPRTADPGGLDAALAAAGLALVSPAPEAGPPPPAGAKKPPPKPPPNPLEQEALCIGFIEDLKTTMLAAAGMRYSPPLDMTKPAVKALSKISPLTRTSIRRNAAVFAPMLETIVSGPWALLGLLGIEFIMLTVTLKQEAVKAGWEPKRRPAPARTVNTPDAVREKAADVAPEKKGTQLNGESPVDMTNPMGDR